MPSGDDCREGAECVGRSEAEALRCACGSLLARYVAGKIELKCRRCKRTVLLPIQDAPEEASRT